MGNQCEALVFPWWPPLGPVGRRGSMTMPKRERCGLTVCGALAESWSPHL